MRGKGRQLDVLVHGVRITPAYAGKRACTAVCSTNATGSPPRMRGKAFPQGVHVVVVGITPAYAGKSQTVSFGTTGRKDHPRVCGEKKMEPIIKVDNVWITPAYAGKRKARHGMGQGYRDHPRVCGEKNNGIIYHRRRIGSPPRMRGKGIFNDFRLAFFRITPAYAGKSLTFLQLTTGSRDHPRVCGEKNIPKLNISRSRGSPPRMRGKGRTAGWTSWKSGITPAYAGKRLKRSRSTVPPVAIVPLFPSVCNKPVVSDGSPAGRDAPLFLPAENAVPASPAYNLRSL